MEKPRVLESVPRFHGKIFSVRTDTVEIDARSQQLDIVEHRGSFAIVATPSPERIVLVRQYRHAAGRDVWEIPAGMAEPGELPRDGALRELREETGYRARSLAAIATVLPTPGFCEERLHLFHATDLESGAPSPDDDESIDVREFTLEEAWSMQASAPEHDLKTFAALLWLAGKNAGRH